MATYPDQNHLLVATGYCEEDCYFQLVKLNVHTGTKSYIVDIGTGKKLEFDWIQDLVWDDKNDQQVYVWDRERLVKVNLNTGRVSTIYPTRVGSESKRYNTLQIDDAGNIYLHQVGNNQIERLTYGEKNPVPIQFSGLDELIDPVFSQFLYDKKSNAIFAIEFRDAVLYRFDLKSATMTNMFCK